MAKRADAIEAFDKLCKDFNLKSMTMKFHKGGIYQIYNGDIPVLTLYSPDDIVHGCLFFRAVIPGFVGGLKSG